MWYVLISWACVAVLVLVVWNSRRQRAASVSPAVGARENARAQTAATTVPRFATTQDRINWLAGQAVESAREVDGTVLDYSLESIEKVDRVLGKIYEDARKRGSRDGLNGLAMAYGAYIGECIRKAEPGASWSQDHPAAGERSYPLHWRDGDAFPMRWCFGRLTNGDEDNVWHKYQVLRMSATQGSSLD